MIKKTFFITACLCMALTTSCKEKNTDNTKTVVNDNVVVTEAPKKGGNEIVKDPNKTLNLKLCADAATELLFTDKYPDMDIAIGLPSEENNFIDITIISVEDPENEELFIEWMLDCMKAMNDEAVRQMPDKYAPSSEGYYGGLFDEYDILLAAVSESKIFSRWSIDQKILAGTHDEIVINETEIDLGDYE